jgi:hypothetical protein
VPGRTATAADQVPPRRPNAAHHAGDSVGHPSPSPVLASSSGCGLPGKRLEHTTMAGRFRQSQHTTKILMPTAIPSARRRSTKSQTQRFGALLLALGVSRFLRPRQPNPRNAVAEKRPVRPSDSKVSKGHTGAAAEQKKLEESDRGRAATTPREIPAKGWKDILWRVYQEVSRDRVLSVAAGVTFYALLASSQPLRRSYRFTGSLPTRPRSTNIWLSFQASCRPAPSKSSVSR